MSKYSFLTEEIEALKNDGLFNTIRTIGSAQNSWTIVNGKKVLNMCVNNYLGFADHPELKKRAIQGIEKYGVGPAAVRSIAGTMEIHLEMEKKMAAFKRSESTISFQSGFCSNLAAIPTLVPSAEDVLFTDELNHASIIDGCRLTKARRVIFKHSDPNHLEEQLKKEEGRRLLIITDGVFSMDGDIAPLPELAELAARYDALLMVDDAHGEGVLGESGRGIVDHFHLHGKVDVEVGTVSKAFGVVGGFVSGSTVLTDYLRQKARPFLFSSAVTPADVLATIAAIDYLSESDDLVKKLWDNSRYFKEGMKKVGFDIGHSQTPITPVMLGEASLAQKFSKTLFDKGIFAQAIGFPTVAKGKARIRVMISAVHSQKDLDFALDLFTQTGKELGVI